MPAGRQLTCGLYSWPPAAVIARLPSNMAWYSGVSGACCLSPAGLVGSHWATPGRTQVPPICGYFASSRACAPVAAMPSTAASAIAPSEHRAPITVLSCYPDHAPRPRVCGRQNNSSLEIFQIGSRLAFADGHQIAVGGQNVVLLADGDVVVVLGANIFGPDHLLLVPLAMRAARHRPRAGERMVDRGDFVAEDVRVRLVEKNPLLDDGLAVLMERNAAGIVAVRPLDVAGLDLEHIEPAVAVLVDPFADRITHELRLEVLRPGAPVRIDATKHAEELDHHIGGFGRDHDLYRLNHDHRRRHAGRDARVGRVVALPALGLVRKVLLENSLVFRRQRRLLAASRRLGGIVLARTDPDPLALKVGILRFIKCAGAGAPYDERRRQRDRADQASVTHNSLPECPWARKDLARIDDRSAKSVGDDRLSGDEVGLLLGPGAARRAAAQRINGHLELVAGLERLARPALADESARARAFKIPDRGAAVSALYLQQDEGMRAGELELGHRALELHRMLLIEHRERMVRERSAAHRHQCNARQQSCQCLAHCVSSLWPLPLAQRACFPPGDGATIFLLPAPL